jgi:hypothetical protein
MLLGIVNNNNNNNNNTQNTVPKSVETSRGGKVTILWNHQIQTDRTIPNNKPDRREECDSKIS